MDQLSSSSQLYYLIVDRDTQDVERYDSIGAFEEGKNEKKYRYRVKGKTRI